MSGGTTRRRCVFETLQTNMGALLSVFTLGMLLFSTEFRRNEFEGGASESTGGNSEFGSGDESIMHCGKVHTRKKKDSSGISANRKLIQRLKEEGVMQFRLVHLLLSLRLLSASQMFPGCFC